MTPEPADPVGALRVPQLQDQEKKDVEVARTDLPAWARRIVEEVEDIRAHGQSEGLSAADIVALTLGELVAAPWVTAALPDVWSYEGEKHGRHDVSICLGGLDPDAPHECYATAHAKTEAEAHERAKDIVGALQYGQRVCQPAAPLVAPAGVPQPQPEALAGGRLPALEALLHQLIGEMRFVAYRSHGLEERFKDVMKKWANELEIVLAGLRADPAPRQLTREDFRAARDACVEMCRQSLASGRNSSDAAAYAAAKEWELTASRLGAAMNAALPDRKEP